MTQYMPPELWLGRPYGTTADLWGLGCLLYELMTYRRDIIRVSSLLRDVVTHHCPTSSTGAGNRRSRLLRGG